MHVVIVLQGPIQAAGWALPLSGRHQLDLARDDPGLQLRKGNLPLAKLRPRVSMLGCESSSKVSSGCASDSSVPSQTARLSLIFMADLRVSKEDGFSAAANAASDRQANISGRAPHQIERSPAAPESPKSRAPFVGGEFILTIIDESQLFAIVALGPESTSRDLGAERKRIGRLQGRSSAGWASRRSHLIECRPIEQSGPACSVWG
ncbi:hypothetical protein [Variovorax sp. J22R115]|uniref:hypothetical protein n=1 Tax=Variovorax sp. J22R115 TaxID=3053509 RepID=UPI002577FA07|nr:hypothetical protein [Variovorax sp. J22R115]MDM0053884.1 hypothetical protein [Variovorax sp. J22R115]